MSRITVHIFTAGNRHHAMTYENNIDLLPIGYQWKHVEVKAYPLNDKKFPLLPNSSNEIKDEIDEIDENGFIHFDFSKNQYDQEL